METISPSGSLSHTHILFLTSSGGGVAMLLFLIMVCSMYNVKQAQ